AARGRYPFFRRTGRGIDQGRDGRGERGRVRIRDARPAHPSRGNRGHGAGDFENPVNGNSLVVARRPVEAALDSKRRARSYRTLLAIRAERLRSPSRLPVSLVLVLVVAAANTSSAVERTRSAVGAGR